MTIDELKTLSSPIFEKYGINYAGVFGSFARGDNKGDSDIDFVVRAGKVPHGIWGFVGLKQELEKTIGKEVDIVSESGARSDFVAGINKDKITIYEKSD